MSSRMVGMQILRQFSMVPVQLQRFGAVNVFDCWTKKHQRRRSALSEDARVFDYIKDEIGCRVADRIYDIKRGFPIALDLGCGRGHVSRHVTPDVVEQLVMADSCQEALDAADAPEGVKASKVVIDEEQQLSFDDDSLNLVISSLNLHWINDLPASFKEIYRCLKQDCPFIGCMFYGDTLFELRCSLQLAELEREGGFAPHVSPFVEAADLGGLLNRTGFSLITMDSDEFRIHYPSMFEVMWDLKGMGENNATWTRKPHLHRESLMAAAAIYKEMYGNEDGSVPATFQVLHFIGWKPDPSQPKPAQRGSASVSLKDLGHISEMLQGDKKT